jgi:hypothetical protein
LPLGTRALDFIEFGAPIGQQRFRALAATRNLLARGAPAAEVVELVWSGLERSPQEPGRPAWTRVEAEAIVLDLERREPPPLRDGDFHQAETVSRRRLSQRRVTRRVAHQVRVG